jgi:hypothetical protein
MIVNKSMNTSIKIFDMLTDKNKMENNSTISQNRYF